MNNMKSLVLAAGIVFTLQACNQSSKDKEATGTTTVSGDTTVNAGGKDAVKNGNVKLKPEEIAFIEKAAVGGMMEVELGNLTTQKTKNTIVKDFANRMITDHNGINKDLQNIATVFGLKLPGALPAIEQSHLTAMRQMQGNEYDENYVDMMVSDHSKTLDLFNGAARFNNPELKEFALRTIPVLQAHNKMAIGIDSVIKVKKPGHSGNDLPTSDSRIGN